MLHFLLILHLLPALALHVDASDYAIGGALHQVVDSELQPLAFFFQKTFHLKSLTVPTTVNSLPSTRLSDTFGICWKLEISQCLLTTSPSLILLGQKSDKVFSTADPSQLDFISQFTTNIVHIPGSDNIAADVLSRVSAITFPSQIDYDCIAETQQTDQGASHL
ncbi:retrovirus-related Pol polyprotein from transposon 17.6 [Trichonephila clavipes]|nr:retrovirus-related Pol polyprotein from transposon 17.6 [Trichonephila clavipes]